jgi:hypothetical protein
MNGFWLPYQYNEPCPIASAATVVGGQDFVKADPYHGLFDPPDPAITGPSPRVPGLDVEFFQITEDRERKLVYGFTMMIKELQRELRISNDRLNRLNIEHAKEKVANLPKETLEALRMAGYDVPMYQDDYDEYD